MTVKLTIESATHPQSVTQKVYLGGQMVIGRGDDCDWRLDDPDMYLSRKHCILTDENGDLAVLDASSGGVFIDGAAEPLGSGKTRVLEHQMRLRLGDFVIRVDLEDTKTIAIETPSTSSDSFFDFGAPAPEENARKERPKDLPDPFGVKNNEHHTAARDEQAKPPRPLDQRDPFALDLNKQEPATQPSSFSSSGYFDDPSETTPQTMPEQALTPEPVPPIEVTLDPARPPVAKPPVAPISTPSGAVLSDADVDIRAALFRGLGLTEEEAQKATLQDIEAIGARLRDSVEGLMFLMRTRAQEKQMIRAAQTIIASSDVNPLKFLASTDEALLALIWGRDSSYLSGDKAITAAYRDLADHQMRTWQALQSALRRMIDHFDPEEIEREMEETGFLEQLVAGGRSAKMWQLYQERYRDIAKAAEERFLGEVGVDFRDAYETKGS